MAGDYRCVVCGKRLYQAGRPFGSHKCSPKFLRALERRERAEEERVENYTIRQDEDLEYEGRH